MGENHLLTEVRGRVGIITFNQPDKLNAMSGDMQSDMFKQIRAWNTDDSVGAVVLTGAGRAFCSGADIGGFEAVVQGKASSIRRVTSADQHWVQLVKESKPIICAINGVAVGLGVTLTLPCDIRIASEAARMSFRFVKIGLTPEYGSTHYLVNLVGLGQTLELMLTGKFVQAEEAKEIGLVTHVFPQETFLEEVLSLAEEIANNPTHQMLKVKRLVHENYLEKDINLVLRRETETFRAFQSSPEHKEALEAFRERREPKFH